MVAAGGAGVIFRRKWSIGGLLEAIHKAAARDTLISEGKSLNEREETLLQALEIMTRERDTVSIRARDLRDKVQTLLEMPDNQTGNGQWVGYVLKHLQLTDRQRSRRHNDGMRYDINRSEVLDMMKRYHVPLIGKENGSV